MEEKEMTALAFPAEPKVEVTSPPLSPRNSDGNDEAEPDDSGRSVPAKRLLSRGRGGVLRPGTRSTMGEKETTTPAFPAEPKLEVNSPRNSDDDEETEPDESNGEEEEEGGAGVGAGRAVVRGPPLKKGPWTPEEDKRLRTYVEAHGEGQWNNVQRNAGLNRCGKSCRLRWANHLRPHLKKGPFSKEEEQTIIELHAMHGNKWAMMASALPGRTDNEIKNFWNTRSKRLSKAGLDLYPDGLLSRVANQDMDCHSPEDSRGKKRPNELSQGSGLEFDDIIFEKLDYKKRAENFLAPTFGIPHSLAMDGMNHPLKSHPSSGIVSGYSDSHTYEQLPHGAENTCYTDSKPGITRNHSFPFNNAIANSLPILDGNFSTSGTIQRPMKMERPSIQHTCFEPIKSCCSPPFPPATPLELADKFIASPASVLTKPECFPSQDNCLLDQRHVPTKFQGAYEALGPFSYGYSFSSPSSGFGDNFPEGSIPFDEFRTSQSSASLEALSRDSKHQPDYMFADKFILPDPCMLDASSEAGFLNEDLPHSEFQPMNGPLSAILFGGSCDEATLSAAGDGHQLGLESAPWKSMPGACHISESRNGNRQQL